MMMIILIVYYQISLYYFVTSHESDITIDDLKTGDIILYIYDHRIEEGMNNYLIENVLGYYLSNKYTHVGIVYDNGIITSVRKHNKNILSTKNKTGSMLISKDNIKDYLGYVFVYRISENQHYRKLDLRHTEYLNKEWDASFADILKNHYFDIARYETPVCSEIVFRFLRDMNIISKNSPNNFSLEDIEHLVKESNIYTGPFLIKNNYYYKKLL